MPTAPVGADHLRDRPTTVAMHAASVTSQTATITRGRRWPLQQPEHTDRLEAAHGRSATSMR